MPSLADGVKQKAWFCGPPAHVIEGIKSIEAKYPGLEHFMIHWAEGLRPAEFKEQLRWFAQGRDAGVQESIVHDPEKWQPVFGKIMHKKDVSSRSSPS